MEYSKEDLMEAKKQIWGVGENMGTEESKKIWEENAQFWDNAMGDESNEFHREVVRPKVTELLSPNPADYILDIACGNGNYSSYLAQRGASVVAFDYSKKMIELAKRRQSQYAKQIEFCVADATDRKSILELKRNRAFTKAVSNMAIMDITDMEKKGTVSRTSVVMSTSAGYILCLVLFAVGRSFWFMLLVFLLAGLMRTIKEPVLAAWMNDQVDEKMRATVFSTSGQLDSFGQIIGGPIVGLVAQQVSIPWGLVCTAFLLLPALFLVPVAGKKRD